MTKHFESEGYVVSTKKKICPVCNKEFECTESINCWCTEMSLSSTYKTKYPDCLCKSCLTKERDNE
jgi:hypothetical protein